jgi:hypothetical protein
VTSGNSRHFLVAAGRTNASQQLTVDQATYEVVGEPVAVAALTVVARFAESMARTLVAR